MNLYRDESHPSSSGCGCKDQRLHPDEKLPLAIATIPVQPWETPVSPAVGLKQGSIVPGLVLPFFKEGGTAHV